MKKWGIGFLVVVLSLGVCSSARRARWKTC